MNTIYIIVRKGSEVTGHGEGSWPITILESGLGYYYKSAAENYIKMASDSSLEVREITVIEKCLNETT